MAVNPFVSLCFAWAAGLMAFALPVRADVPEVTSTLIDVPTAVRKVAKPAKVARVRIPIRLTPYEGVMVRTREGNSRIDYRPTTMMMHTLRTRIERVNHFYVKNWHIETLPQAFDKDTLRYTIKLRFFKRYGEGMDLEEQVGSTEIAGFLKHEGSMVFALEGQSHANFNDRQGHAVLAVQLGMPPTGANSQRLSAKPTPATKQPTLAQPEGASPLKPPRR